MDNDEREEHKTRISAATFFDETARKFLTTERGLHAETLVSSMARMSGSLMYRSFGFDEKIDPGTVVLSDQANIDGPRLMNVMLATLQQFGHTISEDNINGKYGSAGHSQLSFKESHDRLSLFFLAYCKAASLSFQDAAFAAAIATGVIIHDCREVLEVANGTGVAVYGFVEGTKTAPYPPYDGSAAPPTPLPNQPKKSWYKVW